MSYHTQHRTMKIPGMHFSGGAHAPLGQGGRFKALAAKIRARGGVRNPEAVAAAIGRAKFGKAKFQKLATAGRKRG